ncbi:ABC transporter permease [Terribacillus halophilus]|uniref:ABC transporter permease n=1 Tax=Terribacillus halophilus TaxID=361279 RepID=UPI000984CFB3|nr:ABC transporter permease [Terribacillus halophilus]
MGRYILNRVGISSLVVLGSMTLIFFLLHILPGDSARLIGGDNVSDERVAELQTQFGLDRPLFEQYLSYITGVLTGNLGTSFIDNQPVLSKIMLHFPATLTLTLFSTLIAIVIGVGLGILSAVYQKSWFDYMVRFVNLFSISMPSFWLGILLILVFSIQLRLLPALGSGTWQQLILPSICLGVIGSGLLARMVRNSVLELKNEHFVLALRAKGLRERSIIYKHVLRNALIPAITVIGILIGELLAGSVVTETVFSRQGIGRLIVDSINQKDIPTIQGTLLIAAVLYILVNLLVDFSYAYIDPRIRKSLVK